MLCDLHVYGWFELLRWHFFIQQCSSHTELSTGKEITAFNEIKSDDNLGTILLQDVDDFQSL